MSQSAIRAQGVGKHYMLGRRRELYTTLRESIGDWFRRAGRRDALKQFWALREVSFDIAEGETVGLIGRNGAGKSTLLKILARVTEPSTGEIRLRGRVGSLLEVGTGFHPELTGRENIFLSGTILGMAHKEITRKVDEIVAFAEVEQFLDTPVKRYSSGMYLRLGFAVAAHLEPDILLVDEVLAVGDAEFQRKCLGQLDRVGRGGRTVLFVSHNMAAVNQICRRAILIDHGRVAADGDTRAVVDQYLSSGGGQAAAAEFPDDPTKAVQVARVEVLDDRGQSSASLACGRDFAVALDITTHQPARGSINIALYNLEGVRIFHSVCANVIKRYNEFKPGQPTRVIARFPGAQLGEGTYVCNIWLIEPGDSDHYDFVRSPMFQLSGREDELPFIGNRKPQGYRPLLRMPIGWDIVAE